MEKGNRMDKREIAAKITQKKEEIKNLIAQDNLEDAKKAREEMKDLQEKYDLLDEMEQEEGEGVKNQAAQGKVNEIKGKKSVVSALVNALRAGFKKKPVAKEDMEVLDAMKEGSDEDGGLTVPADISTTIRTLRRSEDALETIVRTEHTTKVKGSRVYEVNADSIPFDTVDEESQFPDVATPVLKKVEYVIKKFGGILKATYELLEDSDENIVSYLENWIARKVKATRNALIIKKLDEMTDGFEIEATSVDDLKNIFNVELDPALVAGSKALTNQSGFNWLDKLKDKEGNYILQKDVTNPSKRLLFGTYPVVVMSNKTIKSGATGKVPIYCGNFEEAITLFDREKLTIGISTEAGDLWSKDQTGIKVRERLDCEIVDDMAVFKAEIPADQISEPTKKYRKSELEAMTTEEIKQLATTKSYTITKTKKDEIISEFIAEQKKGK
nr:MAG TPA: major capsid protein [Caudoviricetes sp.]